MKQNKNRSWIKEKKVKKDYAGTESSPYREWLETRGDHNQEHQADEPAQANPDILYESDALYFHMPFIDEDQVLAVKRAIPFLSKKQRIALQLVGLEGKTLENAGAIMGISRSNVYDLIERARKIIIDHQDVTE